MQLDDLLAMSHKYGADEEFVLAGGGNTSCKEGNVMYVKGSGTQLSSITAEQFVGMDVTMLCELAGRPHCEDISDEDREEEALREMMASRLPGNESKRPSVEAILHAIFPYKYVLHVHPALINGLTCGINGESVCRRLFGDEAVWIPLTKPGVILSQICKTVFEAYNAKNGKYPQLVLLQNHGVFAAANTVLEIDSIIEKLCNELKGYVTEFPDFGALSENGSAVLQGDSPSAERHDSKHGGQSGFDECRAIACGMAPALRMLYSDDGMAIAVFCVNRQVARFVADANAFEALVKPFTPDHIVYYKDEPLFITQNEDIAKAFTAYYERKGYKPRIVAVKGLGFFALGKTKKEAELARALFLDAVKIAVYAKSFGGILPLTDEFANFILNWEVENYRTKVSAAGVTGGRLEGRIALVTGGAQGFGKGIAEALANEGAYVSVADLNKDGADVCAAELCAANNPYTAYAVAVDVSDAASVERMVHETVLAFGGLDILISNAGVLIAGSLSDMTAKSFDFVTNVNYKGYFLCAKYASEPMKIQNKYAPGFLMDIIEINSKSGLEGSNKNFAYAGSKFGGIGLTQSFAMELVENGIKVNAICPGNLLDGPLWSDPDRGLFRQYLDSGKVPGAKTIADVRKFYEDRVPLKRGCTVEDVARAIFYVIEQKYETGQAIPVTGGQIMLN